MKLKTELDNRRIKMSKLKIGDKAPNFSGLDQNDIDKFMAGKIANVMPYISNTTEGFRGSTTPKDLEYAFQMLHAYFTDLNFNKDAFEGYKQKQSNFYI